MIQLDLGAADTRRDKTWTTVDLNAESKPDVVCDLSIAPWPWADGSVDLAFSTHVLEHFDEQGARVFLTELRRVLRPGGWARIGVPDCRLAAKLYVEGTFWKTFAPQDRRSMLWDFAKVLGGQFVHKKFGERGYLHQTQWDEPTLRWFLRECGWTETPIFFGPGDRGTRVEAFRHDDYWFRFGRGSIYVEIRRA